MIKIAFRKYLGNDIRNFMINNSSYELIEPKEFLLDLFSFDKGFPKKSWILVTIALVGSMGTGKSTDIQYMNSLIDQLYSKHGVSYLKCNDMVYSLNYLNRNIEKRTKIQSIVFDDALSKGFDSRTSMTSDNIDMSQNYAIARHILANEDKFGKPDIRVINGIAFIFFAIQSYSRLDKFIRDNLDLVIFKNYYKELEKELDSESIQFLKDITKETTLRHNFDAFGYGLGVTRTNEVLRIYFPETQFEIPVLVKEENDYADLSVLLKDNFILAKTPKRVIMGFIRQYCKNNELDFKTRYFNEIIEILSCEQYMTIKNQSEENKLRTNFELIHRMRKQKISYDKIAKSLLGYSGDVYRDYHKWCEENEITAL